MIGLPVEDLSEQEDGLFKLLLLVQYGAGVEVGFRTSCGVGIGEAEQQQCFL